jgi:phosphate-selective porin OprO/OprP
MRNVLRVVAVLALVVLAAGPVLAQESVGQPNEGDRVSVFNNLGILTLQTNDGNFKWFTDARLYIDMGGYWGSERGNSFSNGASINEARLALNFTYSKDWISQIDVSFYGNATEMKDIWIGYTGFKDSLIRVGHFKGPYGLENLISSRFISFMERPMVSQAFKPGRNIGLAYSRWGKSWQGTVNVFNQGAGDVDTDGEDMGYGYGARFSVTPLLTESSVVHLGLSGVVKTPKAASGNTVSLKASNEGTQDLAKILTTKKISNMDKTQVLGLEAAGRFGPFSVQAEYAKDDVKRTGGKPEPTFSGWYGHVSYFLTDDQRPYETQTGEFDRVIPKGKWGAVELLARYSTLDLNDLAAGIKGGSAKVTSLGLNWYLNYNSRIMFDLARVQTDKYAIGDRPYTPDDTYNYAQMRFQLNF